MNDPKTNEELYIINQYLASIVNSSEEAIIGKDLNGVITSWNKGAEDIYGYLANEIIGKNITLLSPTNDISEIQKFLQTIREGGQIVNYETTRKRKDGKIINVVLTISPIKDIQGAIIGASTIAQDITRQKTEENELRKTNEELTKMNSTMVDREMKMIELKKEIEK